jgi:hypothetical protein
VDLRNYFKKILVIIIWHCANHRLELTIHDAVRSVSGINRFKSFIDKAYVPPQTAKNYKPVLIRWKCSV